jgi:hypothetical protein
MVFLLLHVLHLLERSVIRTIRRSVLEPKPSHAARVLCKVPGILSTMFYETSVSSECLCEIQILIGY